MDTQPLEVIRTTRPNKIFIALRSRRSNSIVAMGKFPANCPSMAISHWIHTKNQEYLMFP